MRNRWLWTCLIVPVLTLAASAKPPDLPAKHKVVCTEKDKAGPSPVDSFSQLPLWWERLTDEDTQSSTAMPDSEAACPCLDVFGAEFGEFLSRMFQAVTSENNDSGEEAEANEPEEIPVMPTEVPNPEAAEYKDIIVDISQAPDGSLIFGAGVNGDAGVHNEIEVLDVMPKEVVPAGSEAEVRNPKPRSIGTGVDGDLGVHNEIEALDIMPKEAVPPSSEAEPVGPSQARTLFRIGMRCYRKGDFDMAVNCFQEVQRICPTEPLAERAAVWELRTNQARILDMSDEQASKPPQPEARPAVEEQEPLSADDEATLLEELNRLGDQLRKQTQEPPLCPCPFNSQPETSPAPAQKPIDLDQTARQLYDQGRHFRRTGDFEQALRCFRAAQIICPDSPCGRKALHQIQRLEAQKAGQRKMPSSEPAAPEGPDARERFLIESSEPLELYLDDGVSEEETEPGQDSVFNDSSSPSQ
jgi:tetratricopeptide (TPR) repeat protein